MVTGEAGLEWRYLPARVPVVKHALKPEGSTSPAFGDTRVALCGITPWFGSGWWGTDNADQLARVDSLRPCRRCVVVLGKSSEQPTVD